MRDLKWITKNNANGPGSKQIHLYCEKDCRIINTINEKDLQKQYGDDFKALARRNSMLCNFIFNPRNNEKITDSEIEGISNYNTYETPYWQKFIEPRELQYTNTDFEIPSIYMNFLNHLHDSDDTSVEYILDLMSYVITTDRVPTTLLLDGPQGTGKNTFVSIFQQLLGEKNCTKTNDRIFKSNFNSEIGNRILVHIDEVYISKEEEINRFKDLINDEVTIEAKHENAQSIANHATYIITTNNLDIRRFGGKQRRLSLPKMTSTPMVENSKIYYTRNALFDPNNIAKLGIALMHREVTRDMNQVFISDTRQQDFSEVNDERTNILKNFFSKQASNREFSYKEIKKETNIGRSKQEEFCKNNADLVESFYKNKTLHFRVR